MTLNGVIALILLYFTEFDSFAGLLITVVEDRPILSAEYCLPLLAKTDPQCSLSAIAELLVLTHCVYANLRHNFVSSLVQPGPACRAQSPVPADIYC